MHLVIVCITIIGLTTQTLGEKTKTNGNDQILKTEIEEAILECGDINNEREFLNRRAKMKMSERYVRNVMEQIEDFTKEQTSNEESASGEWDYGGKKNLWESSRDSNSTANNNNTYQHDKKNRAHWTEKDGGNWTTSDTFGNLPENNRTIQTQNSTRYNQNDVNNFDSRGARLTRQTLTIGKELNFPRKWHEGGRGKRSNSNVLLTVAAQRECLSQCIFTNLNVVDDRGIPKENLFMKLIQEAVTSQQIKVMVEQQAKACFYQLTTESQDDSCSYSNALEHCLGLEIRKRKEEYLKTKPQ